MRCFVLWVVAVLLTSQSLSAQAPAPAERELDRRLEVRRIEAEIKLTEARLRSLEKLLAEYRSFQKFSIGNPLTLTVEETRLQILDARLRLAGLREEKSLLERYRN